MMMDSLHSADHKRTLRRELRQRRQSLTPREQREAAFRLCQQLKRLPEIRRARRISLYLPVKGEIDPTPLIPGSASGASRFIYRFCGLSAPIRCGLWPITRAPR